MHTNLPLSLLLINLRPSNHLHSQPASIFPSSFSHHTSQLHLPRAAAKHKTSLFPDFQHSSKFSSFYSWFLAKHFLVFILPVAPPPPSPSISLQPSVHCTLELTKLWPFLPGAQDHTSKYFTLSRQLVSQKILPPPSEHASVSSTEKLSSQTSSLSGKCSLVWAKYFWGEIPLWGKISQWNALCQSLQMSTCGNILLHQVEEF